MDNAQMFEIENLIYDNTVHVDVDFNAGLYKMKS